MLLLSACLILIRTAEAARILGYFHTPSYSHQIFFHPIYRELSLRGHEVTVVTPNPLKDDKLTNLTEIDVSETYDLFKKIDVSFLSNSYHSKYKLAYLYKKYAKLSLEKQFRNPEVIKLMQREKNYFDLILIEGLYPGLYAIQGKFEAPLISFWSLGAQNYFLQSMGLQTHPVTHPEMFCEVVPKLSFLERWDSTIFNVGSFLLYKFWILPEADQFAKAHFGQNIPPVEDFVKNTSLLFMNINPILSINRPYTPNVIEVNHMHIKEPSPLPEDVKEALDSASNGAVYFSLGTNVRFKNMPEDIQNKILNGLAKLPYTVLLKWKSDNVFNKPKNVILKTWFSQQDVLRHPNVKVFVTQGGSQSIEEAVVNAVPMVVIPFLGDQHMNAKMLASRNAAILLNIETLTEDELSRAILEVAKNKKYKNSLLKYQQLTVDKEKSSLETIIWWSEFILRHKGAPHLRSPFVDLPLYQYYLLDVLGATLAVFVVIFFIIYKCFQKVVKSISYKKKAKKN